jgi:regulator of RNase E activity RraA
VLVVDNGGRLDEACVGDLVTLEVQKAGLHGIVIWGLHRDTDELVSIGLPLFSLGTMATGPQRLDPRPADSMQSARVGHWNITQQDVVACDTDGVLFMPEEQLQEITVAATNIRETERQQAEKMRAGPRRSPSEWRSMWRAIWIRLTEQKADYAFRALLDGADHATMSALGPASDRQFPLLRLAETIGESLEPAQ